MGRSKLLMEKREDAVSRQVTFSKRKLGLLKKSYELSTLCDIDLALIMFSPSGRLASFSGKSRIEDIFAYYLSLPEQEREGIENPQVLYSMLCKARKDSDLLTSANSEQTKRRIENLHQEISRTQQEIKTKTKLLRLFESCSMTCPSDQKEQESYEQLLIDLIARYVARLEQLQGSNGTEEVSLECQQTSWQKAPSSPTLSIKADEMMQENYAQPMGQTSMQPETSKSLSMINQRRQMGGPQPPGLCFNAEQQTIGIQQQLQMHNHAVAASPSYQLAASSPIYGAPACKSMQQDCIRDTLDLQHPFAPHPIEDDASLYRPVAGETSSTELQEQLQYPTESAASLQLPSGAEFSFLQQIGNFNDLENCNSDLGCLLASWDNTEKQNELMSIYAASEKHGTVETGVMQFGDCLTTDEVLLPIPRCCIINGADMRGRYSAEDAHLEESVQECRDWRNFIIDP